MKKTATAYDLTTKTVPLETLRPHQRNPRNGDVEAIADSLRVNKLYRPIVTARGVVLAGNHTYAAALQLGWKDIAVVDLDIEPDGTEARRIMIADNRTSDLGRYDDSQLLELIQELQQESGTLEGTGYDAEALTGLIEQLERDEQRPLYEPDPDGADVRLDRSSVTDCPNCGHTFVPTTRTVTNE